MRDHAQWAEEVREALERFKLSDLIAEPPFFFFRNPDYPLWSEPGTDPDGEVELVELTPGHQPPYGIITTQTCDLNEQREFPVQPFFQLSPSYRLPAGAAQEAAVLKRQYLHKLSAPELGDGLWVADLRIEVPCEKSLLVGRDPIAAFAEEEEEIEFAEKLGRRRDRAALGNAVNDILDRKMRDKINNNKKKATRVFESVHRLGLAIAEGPRLEPIAVQLHVITTGGAVPDRDGDGDGILAEVRDWFERWWDSARKTGTGSDPTLRLLPNAYHDGWAMDVTVYESLIPFERHP